MIELTRPFEIATAEQPWMSEASRDRSSWTLPVTEAHAIMDAKSNLSSTAMNKGRQIERARHATNLLKQGVSILDTVQEAGYFDQAHLARSLRCLIGQTPVQIIRADKQLSFLYKTGFF